MTIVYIVHCSVRCLQIPAIKQPFDGQEVLPWLIRIAPRVKSHNLMAITVPIPLKTVKFYHHKYYNKAA